MLDALFRKYRTPLLYLSIPLAVSAYGLLDFRHQAELVSPAADLQNGAFSQLPKITLPLAAEQSSSTAALWRLTRAAEEDVVVSDPATEQQHAYAVKKFAGVEAVYQLDNEKNRWEFYGVARRPDSLYGIFFNPSFEKRKWRMLATGEELAGGLSLRQINGKRALVISQTEAGPLELELKVFYIDMEDFRKKKDSAADE